MKLLVLCCMIAIFVVAAACTGQQTEDAVPTTTPVPSATPPPATPVETDPAEGIPSSWAADGVITEGEYAGSQEVGPGYTVYWNNDAEMLTLGLKAPVEGWVAIGFEPTSRMNEADLVQGWVEDGQATVQDQFSIGPTGPHPPDTDLGGTDDLLERGGAEQEGTTVIEFSRMLDTGDSYDKVLAPGQTVTIIWALSSGDDPNPQHDTGRGSAEITLFAA